MKKDYDGSLDLRGLSIDLMTNGSRSEKNYWKLFVRRGLLSR